MRRIVFFALVLQLPVASCQREVQSSDSTAGREAERESAKAPNLFFSELDDPFGAPPFNRIKDEHYEPALRRGMEEQQREINAIAEKKASPTFENTVEAFDRSGALLKRVSTVFFPMLRANTNDLLQAVLARMEPALAKHEDDIYLNAKLFSRIEEVYNRRTDMGLDPEQDFLVQEIYRKFIRRGGKLSDSRKAELRAVNQELSSLATKFTENLRKERTRFSMALTTEEDLVGLPDTIVRSARAEAERKGLPGRWVFGIQKTSLMPFLTFSSRRDLREKLFAAYVNQGNLGDELDNKALAVEMANLRHRRARLLGFANAAAYYLDHRMASSPEEVLEFLGRLWKPALERAEAEAKELQRIAAGQGAAFRLEPWDWWFYAEKLRKKRYDVDDADLRPYFELKGVRDGAFAVANKLWGLTFTPLPNLAGWAFGVEAFEVREAGGAHVGVFYTDYYLRPNKMAGAWSRALRVPHKSGGKRVAPVVSNVANFQEPSGGQPSLLSFEEAMTLFHEFGHALHSLLNESTFYQFGDRTAMRTDFTELPSQIMERWAASPEGLRLFARHYETGEVIPDELVKRISDSRLFNQGFDTVEYLAACFLDMAWHTLGDETDLGADVFESRALKNLGLPPEITVRYRSTYFQHSFADERYAAGYYSYIWSDVLVADAFEAFSQKGLFDADLARAFRKHILATGGGGDPKDLWVRFRGRAAEVEPLLKSRGLLEQ